MLKNKAVNIFLFNFKNFMQRISSILLFVFSAILVIAFDVILLIKNNSISLISSRLDLAILFKSSILMLINGIFIINVVNYFFKVQVFSGIADIELRYGLSLRNTFILRLIQTVFLSVLLLAIEFAISIVFFLVVNSRNNYGSDINWYLISGCYLLILVFMILFTSILTLLIFIKSNVWPIVYAVSFLFITVLTPFYVILYDILTVSDKQDSSSYIGDKPDKSIEWNTKKISFMHNQKTINYKLHLIKNFEEFLLSTNTKQEIIKSYYEYVNSLSEIANSDMNVVNANHVLMGLMLPYEHINTDGTTTKINHVNEDNILHNLFLDIDKQSAVIKSDCKFENTYLATIVGELNHDVQENHLKFQRECILSDQFRKLAKGTTNKLFRQFYSKMSDYSFNIEELSQLFYTDVKLGNAALNKNYQKLDKEVFDKNKEKKKLFEIYQNNFMHMAINSYLFEFVRSYIVSDHNIMQLFYRTWNYEFIEASTIIMRELWNPFYLYNFMMLGGYQNEKVDFMRTSYILNMPPNNAYKFNTKITPQMREKIYDHYYDHNNTYIDRYSTANIDNYFYSPYNIKDKTVFDHLNLEKQNLNYVLGVQFFIIMLSSILMTCGSYFLYKKSVKI